MQTDPYFFENFCMYIKSTHLGIIYDNVKCELPHKEGEK